MKYPQFAVYIYGLSVFARIIAHDVKVSLRSQPNMHQENHLEIRIVSENAEDPYFGGRV